MRFKGLLIVLVAFTGIAYFVSINVQSHEHHNTRTTDEERNHLLSEAFPAIYSIKAQATITEPGTPPSTSTLSWSGTGFGVTERGLVLTNKHVVQPQIPGNSEPTLEDVNTWRYQNGTVANTSFQLITKDGVSYSAMVVAVHPQADLALLSISNPPPQKRFPILTFETEPILWDTVISIGAPFGFPFTVGEGIISNPALLLENSLLIQTTALVHPGNSGGPLILLKNHKVAGVISAFYNPIGSFGISIGFAIPASIAGQFVQRTVEQLGIQQSH